MENILIYIASPFTTDNYSLKIDRFKTVCECCSVLMGKGLHVFSPIAHGWPIAEAGDLSTDWLYWKEVCETMVSRCQRFIVVTMDGWDESTGVKAEIEYAKDVMGMYIEYMDPITFEICANPPV